MAVLILLIILIPLNLLLMTSGITCFLIGRPAIGWFFTFLGFSFLRNFAYYLLLATGEPLSNSVTYQLLASELGLLVLWGGLLVTLIWAFWEFYHDFGGVSRARKINEEVRALYRLQTPAIKAVAAVKAQAATPGHPATEALAAVKAEPKVDTIVALTDEERVNGEAAAAKIVEQLTISVSTEVIQEQKAEG